MTQTFIETQEQKDLREAVRSLAKQYTFEDYVRAKVKAHEPLTELWKAAGQAGFLGVNLPEEYGGGGAGLYELALVEEELATHTGAGLLMMVVSPAIVGTILSKYGTEEQKKEWLPGMADGSKICAFGITEPDAGSNSHKITTTATRDGSDWILRGQKIYITGVDQSDAVLIVARTADNKTGQLKPALFLVDPNLPGFNKTVQELDIWEPDNQFTLFLDDVRVPSDALVGQEDAALMQLFAGLNPERVMGAAFGIGLGNFAVNRAVQYAKERTVWKGAPIGSHQGISHPLAQNKIELELAKLMMQKAASLYDAGDDFGAAECANMAKYAGAEAAISALDRAIQTHGGSGLTSDVGLASLLGALRIMRVAPVSREMILNFVSMHTLGLPKSY
ncbi:MAG: acyl-CoA/acyl-ACP dehydrogenase [Nocardiaceae bacterium]|nr:acyl-CoA/acyl-ACP dehydrogenase [Nocardiaceae bacterium]